MPDTQEQTTPAPINTQPDDRLPPWRDEPARRSRGGLWFLLLLLLCAAGGGWWWWSGRTATTTADAGTGPGGAKGKFDPAARKVPVQVGKVRVQSLDIHLSGLGNVVPRNVVTVKSRVDGELIKVNFIEGQRVKKGDLLALVDPRPYEVQLTQAAGQLIRDKALLANAELDLKRYRKLLAEDSIASQQVDTQQSLVQQYRGTVETDQGQVDNAHLQLTYCRVASPIDGRVGLRTVDPGNVVHAADATGIVTITQVAPTTVVFTIPEDELPKVVRQLNAGKTLPVDAWDRAGRTKLASGTLLTIDNQIDTTTGTVKLKADFPNEDGLLFPNQFVNVQMLVDTRQNALVMPTAAVQRGTEGPFAYVVKDDGSVTVRKLKLGPTEGENTVVGEGSMVAAGDSVVSDGADKLREGAKVEVTQPGAGLAVPALGPGGGGKGERGKWKKPGADGQAGDGAGQPKAGDAATDAGKGERRKRGTTSGDAAAPRATSAAGEANADASLRPDRTMTAPGAAGTPPQDTAKGDPEHRRKRRSAQGAGD